jgi:hypothetical protein
MKYLHTVCISQFTSFYCIFSQSVHTLPQINKPAFKSKLRSCEGPVIEYFASSLAQAVQLAISVGVLFTYALQMYVPIEILWPRIQKRWGPFKYNSLIEMIFRSFLVLITCKYVIFTWGF